jgi:hypothetical protein
VGQTLEVDAVGHGVGGCLAEHSVTCLVEQRVAEPEQVVDAHEAKVFDVEAERRVELAAEAVGLDAELGTLLDKYAVGCHYINV